MLADTDVGSVITAGQSGVQSSVWASSPAAVMAS
jgi:hypothetical protein